MKNRFTQLTTSAAAIALGMALYEVFPVAHAMPTASTDLHARNAASTDFEDIYLSKVTAKIFGQDATHYDFSVIGSEKTLAIAAAHDYAAAFAGADENKILVTFVNATMAGHLKVEQAEDTAWLCGELDEAMLPHVSQCVGIDKRDILEARSRWNWTKSTSHVASSFGAQVLAGYLGNLAWTVFPVNPRSVCSSGACLSWAKPLAGFTGYFAQQLVQDALSAADLNHYSVEAYGGVNNIDICISNRATGCT
ncbi:hypothetical protein N0V84_000732 [Fusarium piperis]|uniref:WD-like domain-containing protein n=1 Tax=Fusarium piperis TaxID=1435070 RepID=A0A9W9BUV9_9HYPO|nr:hypothetical protein N0V84_000732 [Fusarium piperis]